MTHMSQLEAIMGMSMEDLENLSRLREEYQRVNDNKDMSAEASQIRTEYIKALTQHSFVLIECARAVYNRVETHDLINGFK